VIGILPEGILIGTDEQLTVVVSLALILSKPSCAWCEQVPAFRVPPSVFKHRITKNFFIARKILCRITYEHCCYSQGILAGSEEDLKDGIGELDDGSGVIELDMSKLENGRLLRAGAVFEMELIAQRSVLASTLL
jgi:hypothetical protein